MYLNNIKRISALFMFLVTLLILSGSVNAFCEGSATAPCADYNSNETACRDTDGCWFNYNGEFYCEAYDWDDEDYCRSLSVAQCTDATCYVAEGICESNLCSDYSWPSSADNCNATPGCYWTTGFSSDY